MSPVPPLDEPDELIDVVYFLAESVAKSSYRYARKACMPSPGAQQHVIQREVLSGRVLKVREYRGEGPARAAGGETQQPLLQLIDSFRSDAVSRRCGQRAVEIGMEIGEIAIGINEFNDCTTDEQSGLIRV
jgi:hypothetical protein